MCEYHSKRIKQLVFIRTEELKKFKHLELFEHLELFQRFELFGLASFDLSEQLKAEKAWIFSTLKLIPGLIFRCKS